MPSTRYIAPQLYQWLAFFVAGLFLLAFGSIALAHSTQAALLADYQVVGPNLLHSPIGAPVYIKSIEHGDLLTAEVYGQANYPLERVKAALADPSGWCNLLTLSLNVKACTYDKTAGRQWVTLYMGRKFYQPPDKSYPVRYRFHTDAMTSDYFEISLLAGEGPLGTRDYVLILQAVTIPGGTLIHISSSYRSSTASRWATAIYLATLGRSKIGFSSIGVDRDGHPTYVDGMRGIIERNSLRYYLALQSVLETQEVPANDQFEARIHRWFALTERYRPQLHEMNLEEYLQAKRREHANQLRLQDYQTARALR